MGRIPENDKGIILMFPKGPEYFAFVFDNQSEEQMIAHLLELADDPFCSLTWFDVMMLIGKARKLFREKLDNTPV